MIENIYEDFGKIISNKKRYIPRDGATNHILSRIDGRIFGSFSLVGLPRIGKSTVIYQVFSQKKDELVVDIVLSSIGENDVQKFFYILARSIYKKLKKLNALNDEIEEIYKDFNECNFKRYGTEYFLEFIEVVVDETTLKLIIIIDEFDWASRLFRSSPHYFQVIREMAIQDKYRTAFIFISRRLVEEIELRMDGVSNLRQVLKISYLKPYSDNEVECYFKELQHYFHINNDVKNLYKEFTGYYPYLMDILSVYLVDEFKGEMLTKEDIQNIYQKYINEFYEQYEKIKNLLDEENLFDELLQIAFSMPFDIKPNKVQRLQNYGIINDEGEIFSESFASYLLEQKGLSDYHQIWNKTEKGLKNLSKKIYLDAYGEKWEKEIEKKYQNHNLKKMISSAYFYKREEFKKHNQPNNTSFIDTIATSGLLYLIEEEWHYFKIVFNGSKEEWKRIFTPIKDIRNVIQHNREEVLDANQTKQVILNCEKIVAIVDNYFKSNKL